MDQILGVLDQPFDVLARELRPAAAGFAGALGNQLTKPTVQDDSAFTAANLKSK
jgi:hypothetical protein